MTCSSLLGRGASAGGLGAAAGLATTRMAGLGTEFRAGPGRSRVPPRKRMRSAPSRKSMSLRSRRLISASSYLTVRTSKGLGMFEASPLTNHGLQFPGDACQHLTAVGGDEHVVLDPYAAPVGQVDPRLDGDDHASLENGRRARFHHRRLVDLQADAVSQAVVKKRAEARITDDSACFGIHVTGPYARAESAEGPLLGPEHDRVDLMELGLKRRPVAAPAES